MEIPESSFRIIAVIFAIRFITGEAAFERSSRRGKVVIFRPVLGLRLLFGIGIPGFLYGVSQLMKSGQQRDLLLAIFVFFGGSIALFIIWPGTILIDPSCIRETRWFGLRRTRILWNEVSFAGGDVDNSVVVRSKDDRVIRHTQYHVDRAGFISALKQYCESCSYNYSAPKPWQPLGPP